jgi:hypothetical protein
MQIKKDLTDTQAIMLAGCHQRARFMTAEVRALLDSKDHKAASNAAYAASKILAKTGKKKQALAAEMVALYHAGAVILPYAVAAVTDADPGSSP